MGRTPRPGLDRGAASGFASAEGAILLKVMTFETAFVTKMRGAGPSRVWLG